MYFKPPPLHSPNPQQIRELGKLPKEVLFQELTLHLGANIRQFVLIKNQNEIFKPHQGL